MRVLSLVAISCCSVLLAGIALLWWKLRRTDGQDAVETAKPQVRRQHPRLDLAAGLAPAAQSVRTRHRGQGLQRERGSAVADLPLKQRPDRAYFNPSYGDLRDPDLGRAPAGGVLRPTGSLGKRER